jgi:hypothetical protein
MQCLEVSGAVLPIEGSLGVKGLIMLFIRRDLNYLGNLITNDASCEQIKSTIVVANASFNKKMPFLSTMAETRKMLHLEHSFAWC